MKKLLPKTVWVASFGLLFFGTSCNEESASNQNPGNDGDTKNATIKQTFESEAEFSHMNEASSASGNDERYADASTQTTVFAANNAAFEKLFDREGVNSVAELKVKMGAEAFANMMDYLAIKGNFEIEDLNEGFARTEAFVDDESQFSIFLEKDENSRLVINGKGDNRAFSVSNGEIRTVNGTIITVDGIPKVESNFVNIQQLKDENQLFLEMLSNSESEIISALSDKDSSSTVIIAADSQVETMLGLRFQEVYDADDLGDLLDESAEAILLNNYDVNTMAELLAQITLNDLVAFSSITMGDVIAEFDAEDRTELMSEFIISKAFSKAELMDESQISTVGGATYDISSDAQGNLILTDSDNNKLMLESQSMQSANGTIFFVSEIAES